VQEQVDWQEQLEAEQLHAVLLEFMMICLVVQQGCEAVVKRAVAEELTRRWKPFYSAFQ